MRTLEELDNALYKISDELIDDMKRLDGDIIILGAGGKMGPSLARLAKLSMDAAGMNHKVIAVSRFGNKETEKELQHLGIETISIDLIDDSSLQKLPDARNVIYMAGTKFGTTGNEHYTWAMNAYLPGMVAKKFRNSRIVVFSTGNVYPLTSVETNGPDETYPVGPIGEYAQSCLGRERIFEHFSISNQTPVLIYRLNYAIDLRYGVLLEIGKAVRVKKPINLSMGYVNVIWQGDANQIAIRCLHHCTTPPSVLNVTGAEKVAVRWIAHEFGKLFGIEPVFENEDQSTALLSNASRMETLFPFHKVSIDEMILMTAEWLKQGGSLLDKPTHFQERAGKF
ncbi:MAG TPA: NAD(P)-dependent oxidoreductase [Chryseolinea sp.]|nr:NAD(P)-dependent oxidoreductase [Chryseolinea sp.]